MSDPVVIRPAVLGDVQDIQTLMSKATDILSGGMIWSLESIQNYVKANMTFVALQDEKLVGFILGLNHYLMVVL